MRAGDRAPLHGVRRRRGGHGLAPDKLVGSLAGDVVDPAENSEPSKHERSRRSKRPSRGR